MDRDPTTHLPPAGGGRRHAPVPEEGTAAARALREPGSGPLPLALAAASGAAGAFLLSGGGRTGVTAGIALLVLALAMLGVALGGRPYGPAVEGPLDLSTRLALGLLGGMLAGLAHGGLQWLGFATGLFGGWQIGFAAALSPAAWGVRGGAGAALGLLYGLLLPVLPGRSAVGKAAWLSAAPTLYALLYYFPVALGAGLLGLRLGAWTPLAAALLNLAASLVAGLLMRWGERTELAPLSRPLVE